MAWNTRWKRRLKPSSQGGTEKGKKGESMGYNALGEGDGSVRIRGGIETRKWGIGWIDPTSPERREEEESPFTGEEDQDQPKVEERQAEVSSAGRDGIGGTDGLPRGWGLSKFESIRWVGCKMPQDVHELELHAKVQHKQVQWAEGSHPAHRRQKTTRKKNHAPENCGQQRSVQQS